MDRGAWWATVHGVAESDVPEAIESHEDIHRNKVRFTSKGAEACMRAHDRGKQRWPLN